MIKKSIIKIIPGMCVALLTSVMYISGSSAQQPFSKYVDENGTISFPGNFRTSMVHLGSWFVEDGGASGFHDVYTEASTVEAYRRTGKFPDGATLVKELRPHITGTFSTGEKVSHATGDLKQWFVMVKDTEGRFPENASWGDGWGWSLYMPDNPALNVSADYKADCLGCHVPAQETDWVYVQGYPTLNKK